MPYFPFKLLNLTLNFFIMLDLSNFGISTANDSIQALKEQTFKVFETPSTIFCPVKNLLIPDGFYTISNENEHIHGKVSNKGSVLQMADLIDIAYNVDIDHNLGLQFDKAKIEYFKEQSISVLKVPLGVTSFTNAKGMKDETEVYLFVKTGFGGTSCTEIGVYTHRFVCSNGMEVRNGLEYFKAKHTGRMNTFAKSFLGLKLPLLMNSATKFTEKAEAYDKTNITKADIEAFKQMYFGYNTGDEISTKKSNQIASFNESLDIELTRCDMTAWGLLQGATHYTNHNHFNASKEFVVTGAGATMNQKAEKFVAELV